MKYILAFVLMLWQKSPNPQIVQKQISDSQRTALKKASTKETRWKYEQTISHRKSISYYALQQFDSAYRSQGQDPFSDSLNVVVQFDIAGFFSGIIWRDTTSIFAWEYVNKFSCKMKKVADLSVSQQKVVRESDFKNGSIFRQIAPEGIGGQEHGQYTSFAKWYNPALKRKSITRVFFIPPSGKK